MSDIRKYEPLWGVWRIEGDPLGKGGFGKAYRVVREEFGEKYYAAVKHISIPDSETRISEVIADGIASDLESAKAYFGAVTRDIVNEISLMSQVKGHTNIVSYEDHLIAPKPSGIGYDIFIRMELLTGLNDVLRRQMTVEDVIQLGIDICSALEVCLEKGIIHRDIKPSNIFVNDTGDYKLGDFGVARQLEHVTSGVSKKGTYDYMAPEIYRGEPANFTADTYSLGIVMYRLLNGNRAPFLPVGSASVSPADIETALALRMSGEPLPPPVFAEGELAAVILRATQFDKSKRFVSPTAFKNALLNIRGGGYVERPIPIIAPPTDNRSPTSDPSFFEPQEADGKHDTVAVRENEADRRGSGGKKGYKLAVIVAALMLALIAAVAASNILCSGEQESGFGEACSQGGNAPIDDQESSSSLPTVVIPDEIVIGGQTISTDVTELDLSSCGLTDISDLKYCMKLETLILNENSISDISALMNCQNLINLEMGNNNISDISALAYCTKLRHLYLYENNISDISAIAGCSRMVNLELRNNNISDVSVLANFPNLEYLTLSYNFISNISALKNCTRLTTLFMSHNAVSDISALANCPDLKYLYVYDNYVSDISALANCRNLGYLGLSDNPVSDVSVLVNCHKLKMLAISNCNLSYTQISDIRRALPDCEVNYTN